MNPEFWLDNWKNNKIGFHQAVVNPYLAEFWGQLEVPAGSRVFVPLCGKSLDLIWLRQQGHQVLGIELSELAANQFFSENGLAHTKIEQDGLCRYGSDRLTLLQGDFFNLKPTHLHDVVAVFDRASLVALPGELRQKYVLLLKHILPAQAKILLVTFEYSQAEMTGPPFSVNADEVQALYQDCYQIALLTAQDVLEQYPQFKTLGLTTLQERVYLMTPLFNA